MPGSVSLTSADTIIINNRLLTDLGSGDIVKITYSDDLGKVKAGKDGNLIFALNQQGRVAEAEVKVLLGSSDDAFLNGIFQTMLLDFASFILMTGYFTKRVGDGQGNLGDAVYQLAAGVIKRLPDATSNAEGNPEQSEAVWRIVYGSGEGRLIQ